MAINPNCGEVISIDAAKKLINAFKVKYPNEIQCSFVGIEKVNLILNQEGCMGIRLYNGYDEDLERFSPVLIGVDAEGNDMTAVIIDRTAPCPPDCDTNSLLNN
ncbi:hypothetical protein NHF50_09880 [Flavobacterium sp. NRK F10]|uniref:Uncharacterized protein n=1 Tax=Flavobacterium sediminis TaxID=2201181 RepID=A0A2U8QWI0_9FLAO|nr:MULTISPECIES: hypothetical protein [Flavobacterium]AWM14155.1 hypothetical protein DI487_10055 [Flavobacterium sediminis]MCO6175351.1 hypothetical protein [Flavobacterium sp. NRK F10]